MIETLLKCKKDIILDEDEDGNTPLHLAALNGFSKSVKVLIDSQADFAARYVCTPSIPATVGTRKCGLINEVTIFQGFSYFECIVRRHIFGCLEYRGGPISGVPG